MGHTTAVSGQEHTPTPHALLPFSAARACLHAFLKATPKGTAWRRAHTEQDLHLSHIGLCSPALSFSFILNSMSLIWVWLLASWTHCRRHLSAFSGRAEHLCTARLYRRRTCRCSLQSLHCCFTALARTVYATGVGGTGRTLYRVAAYSNTGAATTLVSSWTYLLPPAVAARQSLAAYLLPTCHGYRHTRRTRCYATRTLPAFGEPLPGRPTAFTFTHLASLPGCLH